MERVLIVDDDVELCELVAEYLAPEGFVVEARHDGAQGLERALQGEHDLLILDVMLPHGSGLEVLKRLRASQAPPARTPVLMLTARGDEVDRIVGLELGADDYLPKPFNPRELMARIRAILRRARPEENAPNAASSPPPPAACLTVEDITMDAGARSVQRAGRPVELTSVEFDLLAMLLREAGRVVARDDMTRHVLGRKPMPFDRSVDMHVSNIRKKLGPAPDGGERIKTVRSVGYIYVFKSDENPAQGSKGDGSEA